MLAQHEKKEVILFGYGKFGRVMYHKLKEEGFRIRVATMMQSNNDDAVADHIPDVRAFNPKHNDSISSLGIDTSRHLLYCVMDHTANNLFLVLSLRELYHEATIVAISNSDENTRKLRFAGADIVINIYDASANHIVSSITKPSVTKAINTIVYERNDLKIAEVVLEKQSSLNDKTIKEIDFKSRSLVLIAIIDKELGKELIYMSKGIDHKLDEGDTLVLAGTIEAIDSFREAFHT